MTEVKKEFVTPLEKMGFSQIVKVSTTGPSTTLWISGQQADEDNLEEGIKEQTDSALKKMKGELEKSGATMDDVVKILAYIKDIDQDKIMGVARGMNGAFKHLPKDKRAASTWIGVTGLAEEKALVEIEAIAIVPASKM